MSVLYSYAYQHRSCRTSHSAFCSQSHPPIQLLLYRSVGLSARKVHYRVSRGSAAGFVPSAYAASTSLRPPDPPAACREKVNTVYEGLLSAAKNKHIASARKLTLLLARYYLIVPHVVDVFRAECVSEIVTSLRLLGLACTPSRPCGTRLGAHPGLRASPL
jgi:hypothetical protein